MDSSVYEKIQEVLDAPSCYPECERKSRDEREKELISWYEKYQEVNICYNLYGIDRVISAPADEWLDRGLFRKQRHDINGKYYPFGSKFPYDYTVFMRDKLAFEMLMRSIFGDGPEFYKSYGLLMDRRLYEFSGDGKEHEITPERLYSVFEGRKMVFKNTFGFGGSDIMIAKAEDGMIISGDKEYSVQGFLDSLYEKNSIWLIQKYIEQHPFMSDLNSSSVNTIRILTYNTGARVVIGKAVLRFGKEGNDVDNCDRGGFFTGIYGNGIIGDSKFNYVEKKRYPCPFAGRTIPFYDKALDIVAEAHRHIPQLFTVGWDIVIGPDGPFLLEGNDGWDPYLSQAPEGNAQRKTWNELLEERNR